MSLLSLALTLVFMLVPTPLPASSGGPPNDAIERIRQLLPPDWSIAESNDDVLPEGHYWGMDYQGRRGKELVIQGPRDVSIDWRDSSGVWHKEPVAKEALRVWLMPGDYRESWRRFFVMKRPATAPLLFSGLTTRVYALPSARTTQRERVESVLKRAEATAWGDAPRSPDSLTWKTWQEDLRGALTR